MSDLTIIFPVLHKMRTSVTFNIISTFYLALYLGWFSVDRTTVPSLLVQAYYRRDHRTKGIMLAPRAKGLWFNPRWTNLNIFVKNTKTRWVYRNCVQWQERKKLADDIQNYNVYYCQIFLIETWLIETWLIETWLIEAWLIETRWKMCGFCVLSRFPYFVPKLVKTCF